MTGSSTQKGCQDSRRSGKGTKENDGRWEEDQRPGWQDDERSRQFNLGLLKIAPYLPVMGSNYCLFVCSAINVLSCMLLVKALELHSNYNYILCPDEKPEAHIPSRREAATLRFIDKIESSAHQRLVLKMCVYFVKTASVRNLLCTGDGQQPERCSQPASRSRLKSF